MAGECSGQVCSPTIKEVTCKSALQPSGLRGLKYTINPYKGCSHGCVYCYSPFILREERPWGTFVDVRRNMPSVLAKELRDWDNAKEGTVGIGTVTDAYQPAEARFEVTRLCLEQLLKHDVPISIQTKSALIVRDLQLIKKFSKREVGMTITALDSGLARCMEPYASPYKDRIATLRAFSKEGVPTWTYIGPILPLITEMGLDRIVQDLAAAGVGRVMVDRLRPRGDAFRNVDSVLSESLPQPKLDALRRILASEEASLPYFMDISRRIEASCRRAGLPCEVFTDKDRL